MRKNNLFGWAFVVRQAFRHVRTMQAIFFNKKAVFDILYQIPLILKTNLSYTKRSTRAVDIVL